MWRRSAIIVLPLLLGACGAGDAIAEAPEYAPEGQTKCQVMKSQKEPLIIEWPATQRAKLEAMAARGAIAVRYDGCEMEVMAGCKVPREYGYTATTRGKEHVKIKDEDELYARLPLGAARLSANLEKAGELNVSMTIVGTFETDRSLVHRDELEGACGGATHVVDALIVGAFKFFAGAEAEVGAEGGVGDVGAGAKSSSEKTLLRSAGDEEDCEVSTDSDMSPPDGCGALLRVEVNEIARARPRSPVASPDPPRRTEPRPDPEPQPDPQPDPEPVAQPSPDPVPDPDPVPYPRPQPATAPSNHGSAPSFTPYQKGQGWNYETAGATWYWWILGGVGGALLVGGIIGGVAASGSDGPETGDGGKDLGSATVGIASW